MKNNVNVAEQVFMNLRELVRDLPHGHKLPTMRSLMKEYGVSLSSLTKAIDKLQSIGALRREHGKGIYVQKEGCRRRMLLALPLWPSMRCLEMEMAFTRVCSGKGWQLQVLHYDLNSDWLNEITLQAASCDGVALEIPSGSVDPETLRKLVEFPRPLVMLDQDLSRFGLDSVSVDHAYGGRLAAQALIGKGHMNIAVLAAEPKMPSTTERIEGFVEQARLQGIEAEIIDCNTPPGEDCFKHAYDKIYNTSGYGFTGLFVDSDSSAFGVLKAFYDKGVHVPRQISVIGFDGIVIGRITSPSLSTFAVNYDEMVSNVLERLGEMAQDNLDSIEKTETEARKVLVKPFLLDRQSLGECEMVSGST